MEKQGNVNFKHLSCNGVMHNKKLCPWSLNCQLYRSDGKYEIETPGYYVRKEFRCNFIIKKGD
jgi:hypothetical protein